MCKFVKLGVTVVATILAVTVNPGLLGLIFIACPLCKVVAGLLGKECCGVTCCSAGACKEGSCDKACTAECSKK